jgi:hypothetical protein
VSSTKKIFFNRKKIPCFFRALCYSISMFKIRYQLIHNRGCETVTIQNRSVKRAMRMARNQAWEQYAQSGATNWADVWLTITNPYGKVVYADFAPSSAI